MSRIEPRISIGVPVYNGENFIRVALDSILDQTFKDFEVIIADNASTDRTEEICREYAAKDSRIRYYRNPTNIGAGPNHNLIVQLAKGEYFAWVGHDDARAPEYFEKCVEVLDREQSVVLCHSLTRIIDENGATVEDFKEEHLRPSTNSSEPEKRFANLIHDGECYKIYGLIRLSALRKTRLIENYAHGDGVLLVRLGLLGRYHEIPEYLSLNRHHSGMSTQIASRNYYAYTAWFDTKKVGRIVLPQWQILWGYFQALQDTPLSLKSRILCYIHLLNYIRWRSRYLLRDVLMAAQAYCKKLWFFLTGSKKELIEYGG
ncbi:MAG: glycosyltransferase family 2 protein [Synechococcales cyanobacterium C42_A2020_086]|jgi:glycosyltransferase involved in cell wall biosynthesis|nr:glycosyltransferase family 2 protein [Synechococcales cyanobacterium C42_A2020_086]